MSERTLTKKLMIISESKRRLATPGLVEAIERFSGVYFRLFKKYVKQGLLENVDVLILTKDHGLIEPTKPIPYSDPTSGYSGKLSLSPKEIEKTRKRNLEYLRQIFTHKRYSEIYVNVGRQFIKLIEGFERLSSAKINYASGRGLGPKAAHMKEWILKQLNQED